MLIIRAQPYEWILNHIWFITMSENPVSLIENCSSWSTRTKKQKAVCFHSQGCLYLLNQTTVSQSSYHNKRLWLLTGYRKLLILILFLEYPHIAVPGTDVLFRVTRVKFSRCSPLYRVYDVLNDWFSFDTVFYRKRPLLIG